MAAIFSLTGKRILVTGASSGIGREVCRTAALAGAAVVASGRDRKRLTETVEGLAGEGHLAVCADLTDDADRQRLVEEAGLLNGFVHAAGILKILPFNFVTEEALQVVQRINFEAPALLCRALLRAKAVSDGGSIIFLTSVAATHAAKGHAIYAASKAALESAARVLALELGTKRIRVNCLAPGMVRTAMASDAENALSSDAMRAHEKEYPLGFGEPSDVAGVAAFLLSDASRWVTGTTVVCDGGFSAR